MKLNQEEYNLRAALTQIETPVYNMEGAVRSAMEEKAPVRRHPLPRTVLVAAALVLLLAVGAAASVSGLWARFFVSPIPQNAVTTVGVSQTAGGYTLTLEDAMADDNGTILLLSLRRADGESIDPNATLRSKSMTATLFADGKSFSGRGGFERPVLSEDGKALFFCFEAQDNSTNGDRLAGKALTFTADGVAAPIYTPDSYGYKPEGTIDLSPLADWDIPDLSDLGHWEMERESREAVAAALGGQTGSLPLPLDGFFPQNVVRGAVTLEDGLAIALAGGTGTAGDYVCAGVRVVALIDTRNGTRYGWSTGRRITPPGGERMMLYSFDDCPLTGEDLPYLELEVFYDIDHVLSSQPFTLDFTADSGAALIVPLEETLTVAAVPLHPFELRLSALSASISFNDISDTVFDAIRAEEVVPIITLKDGSVMPAVWWCGYGAPDGTCSVAFRLEAEDGSRIFLDTAQIQSVTFGGTILWTAP